jgi:dihydrofolate synthase / folylpolyglutamate synthase
LTQHALPATLDEWLQHIERVHPRSIDMGLSRVNAVKASLHLAPSFPLITVGGTNGKGSACAMLEAILHHAGYKVGCYTSPHLMRYNERVRIARQDVTDEALSAALSAVETARGTTALTYFEFSTLAAVWLFVREGVDCGILEVGLGGRLDAVNVFDGDCAMVMTIALDHMDYLGDTREQIAIEKAGILRAGRPAICGDEDPPVTLMQEADRIGAHLLRLGRDFGYTAQREQWGYWGPRGERHGLPYPALRGRYQLANAAAALAALDSLHARLPVTMGDVRDGLLVTENPGRFQVLPGRPLVILDVAHNPHAARCMADNLRELPAKGRTFAVFAMLRDKDIGGVIRAVTERIDHWFIAGTVGPRGADAPLLREQFVHAGVTTPVTVCDSIAAAYGDACEMASEDDKIVVFGSFYTVAAVMAARSAR